MSIDGPLRCRPSAQEIVSPRGIPPVRASDLVRELPCLSIIRIGISIRTQKSVPKIVDDGEIAVGMSMMNKMELLLSPEPSKS